MASGRSSAEGGGRSGGGDSSLRPPIFRSEAERRKWNRFEGARKRSARRCSNWGLTPSGKLARYANGNEGSSSGRSCRPPLPPVYDSSSEDEEDAALMLLFSPDEYVHDDQEEEAVIAQVAAVSKAGTVRQVREYQAARREARILRVNLEIVELDSE